MHSLYGQLYNDLSIKYFCKDRTADFSSSHFFLLTSHILKVKPKLTYTNLIILGLKFSAHTTNLNTLKENDIFKEKKYMFPMGT